MHPPALGGLVLEAPWATGSLPFTTGLTASLAAHHATAIVCRNGILLERERLLHCTLHSAAPTAAGAVQVCESCANSATRACSGFERYAHMVYMYIHDIIIISFRFVRHGPRNLIIHPRNPMYLAFVSPLSFRYSVPHLDQMMIIGIRMTIDVMPLATCQNGRPLFTHLQLI